MKTLNALACFVAVVIVAGELARFGVSSRFIPMALDELMVASALIWAAGRSRRDGAIWHLAAWGAFCGLSLVLLVETADHQLHGPAKEAGGIYLGVLSAMLVLGLWSIGRAIRLSREKIRR